MTGAPQGGPVGLQPSLTRPLVLEGQDLSAQRSQLLTSQRKPPPAGRGLQKTRWLPGGRQDLCFSVQETQGKFLFQRQSLKNWLSSESCVCVHVCVSPQFTHVIPLIFLWGTAELPFQKISLDLPPPPPPSPSAVIMAIPELVSQYSGECLLLTKKEKGKKWEKEKGLHI